MALSNVSGFPRIGRNRELKFATEGYWRGETSAAELAETAKRIRVENWKLMQDAGIDLIPSNDFSYYDQVLDANYHYIVPELGPGTRFSLSSSKPFDEHAEAMEEVGIDTVPVLIGPVSFLLLSKPADGAPDDFDALELIGPLVE